MEFRKTQKTDSRTRRQAKFGGRFLVGSLVIGAAALVLGGLVGLQLATSESSAAGSARAPVATPVVDLSTRIEQDSSATSTSEDRGGVHEAIDASRTLGERSEDGPPGVVSEDTDIPTRDGGESHRTLLDTYSTSPTTGSSFECGEGSGMIGFYLPWTSPGDYHRFYYRVDGGDQWYTTNWFYTSGYEDRLEYVYPGQWVHVRSGMTFVEIGGGHTVEAWELSSTRGWTNFGTCRTWAVDSGGIVTNQACGPTSPGYYYDVIVGSGYCIG